MKNFLKLLGVIALIAVIGFSMAACNFGNNDDSDNTDDLDLTFTSIQDFNKWLEKQPGNTPDKPYRVKLNVKNLGGHLLRYWVNGGKYVYLDISDSTITSIGEDAFKNCDTLVGITIGNSVTNIGNGAFYWSGLISVTIPDSVTSIGNDTFEKCTSLTSITIPNTVTSIGSYAFSECTSLTSVIIPDSVTSIGSSAFWQCTNLSNITIGSGVTTIENNTFEYCSSLTSVTIPNSVTSIRSSAFRGCTSLTGVTIPDNVTSIGETAFQNCTSLTSVTFQGTIAESKFHGYAFGLELYYKFYETDSINGTPGTYTRSGNTWTKQ